MFLISLVRLFRCSCYNFISLIISLCILNAVVMMMMMMTECEYYYCILFSSSKRLVDLTSFP